MLPLAQPDERMLHSSYSSSKATELMAKTEERFRGRGKQEVVDRLLVLLDERVQRVRQGEHEVGIRDECCDQ